MILSSIEREELLRYFETYNFTEYLKNKNILITGSNGLLGSGIIKWILLENEIYNTNCHIFASTRHPENKFDYIEEKDNITMCLFGKEKEEVKNEKIDYIIHLVAPTDKTFFISKPVETIRVIIDETEKILELAKERNSTMLYASSSEVYGSPNEKEPINENYVGTINSLDVRNGYPIGKKAAEFLCFAMNKEARPSTIQGLFQPYCETRLSNEILRCVVENKNLVMKTDGTSRRAIIYTLDAISAMLIILFKGKSGEAYNITNSNLFLTMKELAENVFKEFNSNLKIEYEIHNREENGYLSHFEFLQSTEKVEALGWKPISNLTDMYKVDIERFKEIKI